MMMHGGLQRCWIIDQAVELHIKRCRNAGSPQFSGPLGWDFDREANFHQTGHGLIGQNVDEAFGHGKECARVA